MSENEKPKYIRVFNLEKANEKYDEGYRVHTPIVTITQEDVSARVVSDISYLMSLSEPTKYDDIEKYKKLPITEQEGTVPENWRVIHHTSKELIVVKDHEPTNSDT